MSKIARKYLFLNESRIWNLQEPAAVAASTMRTNIRSILLGYVWTDIHVECILMNKDNKSASWNDKLDLQV